MIDIKSKFTIDRCPNYPERWYVDWTELGPVEKDITKYKLCQIVFDKIKPWQIGIGKNVHLYRPMNTTWLVPRTIPPAPNDIIPKETFELEEYTEWSVNWISCEGWMHVKEYQYDMFIHYLFRSRTPKEDCTGIIFETLDQAEQFVNLMEQHFTFYALQKDYQSES